MRNVPLERQAEILQIPTSWALLVRTVTQSIDNVDVVVDQSCQVDTTRPSSDVNLTGLVSNDTRPATTMTYYD